MSISYTVYKTTNNINRKIYIGVHRTKNINDGYIGSGKLLISAINKYGHENFSKEILFVYDNEKDMFEKEAELVNEEFIALDTNYNLDLGGRGGIGRSEEIKKRISASLSKAKKGVPLSAEHKRSLSNSHKGKTLSDEHKLKISKGCSNIKRTPENIEKIRKALTGKRRSEKDKNAMRIAFENTPKLVCPHCGKECKPAPFKRWHGDNCKSKTQ